MEESGVETIARSNRVDNLHGHRPCAESSTALNGNRSACTGRCGTDSLLDRLHCRSPVSSPQGFWPERLVAFHRRRGKHPVCFAIVRTNQLDAALAESLLKLRHVHNFADSEQRGSEGVQELLRHANSRITLDLYAQAGMPNKRLAQSKLVRVVLNKGEALA